VRRPPGDGWHRAGLGYCNLSCHWVSESKGEERKADFEFKTATGDCTNGAGEQGSDLTERGFDPFAQVMAEIALTASHCAFGVGLAGRDEVERGPLSE